MNQTGTLDTYYCFSAHGHNVLNFRGVDKHMHKTNDKGSKINSKWTQICLHNLRINCHTPDFNATTHFIFSLSVNPSCVTQIFKHPAFSAAKSNKGFIIIDTYNTSIEKAKKPCTKLAYMHLYIVHLLYIKFPS